MKKLFALFFLSVLIGCSSDSGSKPVPQELVGKWKYVEFMTDYLEFDENGNQIHHYVINGFTVEFKANHTFTSNEIDGYSGGVFTVEDNVIKLTYKEGNYQLTKYRSFYYSAEEQDTIYLTPMADTPTIENYDNYVMAKIP